MRPHHKRVLDRMTAQQIVIIVTLLGMMAGQIYLRWL